MRINGVPRPDKHKKLPAKKLPKQDGDSGVFCSVMLTLTCYGALTAAACVKRWPR